MMRLTPLGYVLPTTTTTADQCDQIGRFLKVLGNKFALKSSQKRLLTFGLIWNQSINVKNAVEIVYATFENIW